MQSVSSDFRILIKNSSIYLLNDPSFGHVVEVICADSNSSACWFAVYQAVFCSKAVFFKIFVLISGCVVVASTDGDDDMSNPYSHEPRKLPELKYPVELVHFSIFADICNYIFDILYFFSCSRGNCRDKGGCLDCEWSNCTYGEKANVVCTPKALCEVTMQTNYEWSFHFVSVACLPVFAKLSSTANMDNWPTQAAKHAKNMKM